MSGVKNLIQQRTKGTKVPTNAEYRAVGVNTTKSQPKSTNAKMPVKKGK